MLSRRDALKGSLAHVFGLYAVGLVGCDKGSKPSSSGSSGPSWPRRSTHEGIDLIELFPNDADESSPMIVAVHGRGDRPDRWIDAWKIFPQKAWIVLPRALVPHGDGFSWFDLHDGQTDEELGRNVGEAESKLWKGIAHVAQKKKKIIVTGFSQGGILSFAMAARHPNEIAYAFPIAGSCPGPILPKDKAKAAPIWAMHGTDDDIIQFKWGKGAVDAFKEQGNEATLKEYPGVAHAVTAEMKKDLFREIVRALPLAS